MSRPISADLRERLVLAVSREGVAARVAAAQFGVSVSSTIVWVRRCHETGSVAPGKFGGYKPNTLSGTQGDWLTERAKSEFTLLRGWAPKGKRLHAKVPSGHWRTMTFIAALRCDRIDALCVLDQPINGASFAEWVEQFLVPTLALGRGH